MNLNLNFGFRNDESEFEFEVSKKFEFFQLTTQQKWWIWLNFGYL